MVHQDLTSEQRTVLKTLVENPESLLREVHQALVDNEDTEFTYSPDYGEGFNEERFRVQEKLNELQKMGLARVEGRGKPWYPTKEGKTALTTNQ